MNEKLFIKVNKKRGLKLKNVKEDVQKLIARGIKYVEINSVIVKSILERINLKDFMREFDSNKPEGYDYTPPFIENDFSLVGKAFDDIKSVFFSFILGFNSYIDNDNPSLYRALEIYLTKVFLKGNNKVEKNVNKIDSIITKIKREEFSADIHYAINAIKGVKAFTLKTIKELALLYVQG